MKSLLLVILTLAACEAFAQNDTIYAIKDQWRMRVDEGDRDAGLQTSNLLDTANQGNTITPLTNAEIPKFIKTKLQSGDYFGWTVTNAYRIANKKDAVYSVEMIKERDTLVVRFDELGNVIRD